MSWHERAITSEESLFYTSLLYGMRLRMEGFHDDLRFHRAFGRMMDYAREHAPQGYVPPRTSALLGHCDGVDAMIAIGWSTLLEIDGTTFKHARFRIGKEYAEDLLEDEAHGPYFASLGACLEDELRRIPE